MLAGRNWKGAMIDRTDRFRSYKDTKISTKSSGGGSTHDNSRELRFKPLTSSIMKIVSDKDSDLERQTSKSNNNEREVSMSSDEPSLADGEGIDVRDRKIEDDEISSTSYSPPFWVV